MLNSQKYLRMRASV